MQRNVPASKLGVGGVQAGRRLSFDSPGQTTTGEHQGQSRTRENRASGIAGRLVETVVPVEADSLPRCELRTKRIFDQRPKEFSRALDR